MWIVGPESIYHVLQGASTKKDSWHTKEMRLPFLSSHLMYLWHFFFICPFFLQKKRVSLLPLNETLFSLLKLWANLHFLVLALARATKWTLSGFSCFNLSSSWTHMVNSSLTDHLSLCVLYHILKGSYWEGRELRIKWTKTESKISTSRDFNWAAISLISMTCSHTFLELSKVWLDSLFARVLTKALVELTNCASTALKNP